MSNVHANRMSLEYEDRGSRDAPVILLIMGLGQQMIAWPETFLEALVTAGFRVVRFDNRDVGRSTSLNGKRAINMALWITARRIGIRLPVSYTLTDMADDAIGLMDALGIASAHIVGVSMGGMIAQILAAKAPEHALSLTSIMSSSGARGLPAATPEIQARLFGRAPRGSTRAQILERTAKTIEMISYADPTRDPLEFQRLVERAAERGYNPAGFVRQLLAIVADGSRVERLSRITAPTLVIHGAADKLIPVACGIDMAKRISGARLEIIEHMAHDLPPSQTAKVALLITDHAHAAQAIR